MQQWSITGKISGPIGSKTSSTHLTMQSFGALPQQNAVLTSDVALLRIRHLTRPLSVMRGILERTEFRMGRGKQLKPYQKEEWIMS